MRELTCSTTAFLQAQQAALHSDLNPEAMLPKWSCELLCISVFLRYRQPAKPNEVTCLDQRPLPEVDL